ncbi:MAG: sigma 54-interacting transcriptional regulator [Bacillota bacterium]|nr:sigma 54-interacting transcriptional regulator [Bacillota bacterium]
MQVKDLMQPVKDHSIVQGGIPGTEEVYLLELDTIQGKPPVIEVTDEYNRKIGEVPRTMIEEILKIRPAECIGEMLRCVEAGIAAVDRECVIFYANEMFVEQINIPLRQLIGRRIDEFVPAHATKTCLKTGQKLILKEGTKGGRDAIIYPLKDRYGEVMGAMVITFNINQTEDTERYTYAIYEEVKDRYLFSEDEEDDSSGTRILGQSEVFLDMLRKAAVVAETDVEIMLRGESGSGKEIVARHIHKMSSRAEGPLVAVNCAAIPENLLESELFGYEKGAFTGAKSEGKAGKFELAEGGTLFLDEIGDMPLTMQTKLLRAIQEKEIEKVGSEKKITVNVRLISATNRPLEEMIANKEFREDLYYRLNTVELIIPALRDRREDLPLFLNYFLKLFNEKYGKDVSLDQGAISVLYEYDWPGNLREFKHCIENAVILNEGQVLNRQAISEIIGIEDKSGNDAARTDDTAGIGTHIMPRKLKEAVAIVEKKTISATLDMCGGDKEKAIEILGLSRRTFYRKLSEYGLTAKRKQYTSKAKETGGEGDDI